jgi:repressor LexA
VKGLSKRQRELLDFIERYVTTHQFSPSYQDIMTHFSYSSPGTVYKHLRTLKRKGVLVSEPGKARSCLPARLANGDDSGITEVALLGSLRLHYAVELHRHQKSVTVASHLLQGAESAYAFSLVGEEWGDEYLCAGDLLILEPGALPEEGESVIATVQQEGVLLRTLHRIDDYLQLTSRNPNLQPLIVRPSDLDILGVVLATVRQY